MPKKSMTNVSYEDQNKQLCFYGRGILSLWEDCLTNSALPTNAGSGLVSQSLSRLKILLSRFSNFVGYFISIKVFRIIFYMIRHIVMFAAELLRCTTNAEKYVNLISLLNWSILNSSFRVTYGKHRVLRHQPLN